MALDPQTIAMLRQRGILPQQPAPQPMGGMAAGQQRPMPPPPMQRPPMPQQPMRAPPPQQAPMPRAMPQQPAMRAPAGPSMPPGAGTIRGADIDIATPTSPRAMPTAPATPSLSGGAVNAGADFASGFQTVQSAKDAKTKKKAAGAAAPASSPAATPSPSSPSTIQAADLDTGGPPPRALDPSLVAALAAQRSDPQGDYAQAAVPMGDEGSQAGAAAASRGPLPPPVGPSAPEVDPSRDPTFGQAPGGYQSPAQVAASMPAAGSPEERAAIAANPGAALSAPGAGHASGKAHEAKALEGVGWKGGATERQGEGRGGGDFVGLPQAHAGLREMSTVSPQVRAQMLGALKQEEEAAIGKKTTAPSTWGTGEGVPGGYEGGQVGAEREANADLGQQYLRDAAQFALSGNQEAAKAADIRRKLGQHLEEQAKLDDAANRGIDPNRLMKNAGVGRRIGLAIAAGLGAFGASLTHGQNWAMQHIEKRIDNDIEAQKLEVEQAGHRAAAHRSDYGQKLQLLGDPNAAEAAAKADQFAYAAAKAKYEGTQTNDRILKSRADTMAADFAGKAAMYNQETHRLVQTGAADPVLKRMQEIRDHSGGTVTVDEARRQATAEVLSARGQTGVEGTYPKPGKGSEAQNKEASASRDAIANIDKLLAMREQHNGGTLSPEARATAEALAARTQERLVAALGKSNAQLLQRTTELVPSNPLEMKAAGLVGSDPIGARLRAARQMLLEEQQRRGTAPPSADSGDEDIREAGGDEK